MQRTLFQILLDQFFLFLVIFIVNYFYSAKLLFAPCFYIVSYEAGNMAAGNVASTYYEQGQMDMAIMHYKQAIECDSGFLEAYNNLVGSHFG